MKKILSVFLVAGLFLPCFSQTTNYSPMGGEGAVYYLPKTGVKVHVRVEKTTYTPGELCKYAERSLKMTGVAQEASETYRVVSYGVSTFAIPDKDRSYTMKLNAKSAATNVVLSDEGVLLAINAEPRTIEEYKPFVPAKRPVAVNPRQFLTEEMLAAGSYSKLAELVALEIYDIRDSRAMLTRGQADYMPSDGEQLRLMLNDLAVQDEALTSLFCGTTVRDTTEHVVTYIPEPTADEAPVKEVLFRLSKSRGIVDADDLSGAPYYVYVEDLFNAPDPDEDAMEAMARSARAGGVYVNVPGKVLLKLYQGAREVLSTNLFLGQFGYPELLSNDLFFKHPTTKLTLNPITGGVLKLEAESPK